MLYPVAIAQEETHFIAKIPDLPELPFVTGDSMADTITKVRQDIISHLQMLSDDNRSIPKGQELNSHLHNPEFFGHTWAIISLDSLKFVNQTLAIRLNIPRSIVGQIEQRLLADKKIQSSDELNTALIEGFALQAIKNQLA